LSVSPPDTDKVRVYIGAGSNIEPAANLAAACRGLTGRYGELQVSSVYRTRAVGFDGDDFLNLVISFVTDESPRSLITVLEHLQEQAGRRKTGPRFTSRTLDLDLLLYGDETICEPCIRIPRDDIQRYGFVLAPLAELAADLRHPQTGERIADLWARCPAEQRPVAQLPLSSIMD